ncbi:MAG: hypothetical protein ACLP07_16590 [Terracidiphilus sp.]
MSAIDPGIIAVGTKVYLKACRAGEPGTVVRVERGKLVVYWRDLDYWSRHRLESLELAKEETAEARPTDTASDNRYLESQHNTHILNTLPQLPFEDSDLCQHGVNTTKVNRAQGISSLSRNLFSEELR